MRLIYETTIQDRDGEDHEYYLIMHPAREGNRVLQALTPLLSGLDTAGDSNMAMVAGMATGLQNVDLNVMLKLLSRTTRDGEKLNGHGFDKAYQGNYAEMGKALHFAFESNFGDLLELLKKEEKQAGKPEVVETP